MNKSQFMASVKRESLHPDQIVNDPVIDANLWRHGGGYGTLSREAATNRQKTLPAPHGRFVDTWINFHGTWQCVSSQSTLLEKQN